MSPVRRVLSTAVALLAVSIAFAPSSLAQTDDFDVLTLGLLWESEALHNSTLWSIAWSPNESYISATFFDNTTVVVNSTTGEALTKIGPHREEWLAERTRCDDIKDCQIEEHYPARSSTWSPDGKYLAVGGDDTYIKIYDTESWEIEKVLSGHEGSVLSVSWSPDGMLIASGSGTDKVSVHNEASLERIIKIWDFETGIAIQNLTGHKDGILQLRWSSDQSKLVSASDDSTLRMWNTTTWNNVLNFTGDVEFGTGHSLGVLTVDWSPNETLLVSGSRDYSVVVWNATTAEQVYKKSTPNCIRSVDWHPYAELFSASGVQESYLMIRNTTTGSTIKTFSENEKIGGVIQSSGWSPDGKRLAAGSNVEAKIRVYEFGAGGLSEPGGLPDWVPGLILFFVIFAVIIVVVGIRIPSLIRKYERR